MPIREDGLVLTRKGWVTSAVAQAEGLDPLHESGTDTIIEAPPKETETEDDDDDEPEFVPTPQPEPSGEIPQPPVTPPPFVIPPPLEAPPITIEQLDLDNTEPCVCGDPNCQYNGVCHCGCGGTPGISTRTDLRPDKRMITGRPTRFIIGHRADRVYKGVRKQRKQANRKTKGPLRNGVSSRVWDVMESHPGIGFTTQQLAERANCTVKQVSNSMIYIRRAGMKVVTPSKGVWVYKESVASQSDVTALTHDRRVALWEALKAFEIDGQVDINMRTAVDRAGINHLFPTHASFRDTNMGLLSMGAVKTKGPRIRIMIQHPNEIHPELAASTADVAVLEHDINLPQNATDIVTDVVESVPSEDLAEALAKQMWNRYEFALTEIGRLASEKSRLEEENRRLRGLAGEVTVDAREVARRMLLVSEK